jgi:hypothetical protein
VEEAHNAKGFPPRLKAQPMIVPPLLDVNLLVDGVSPILDLGVVDGCLGTKGGLVLLERRYL